MDVATCTSRKCCVRIAKLRPERSSMRVWFVAVVVISIFNGRVRIAVVLLALGRRAMVAVAAHQPVAPVVLLVPVAQIPVRGGCAVRQTIRQALARVMTSTRALGTHRNHEHARTRMGYDVDVVARPVRVARRGLQLRLSHERFELLLRAHAVPICRTTESALHRRIRSRTGRCGPQQEGNNQLFYLAHFLQKWGSAKPLEPGYRSYGTAGAPTIPAIEL